MEDSPWKTLAPTDIRTPESWTRFLAAKQATLYRLLSNSKAFTVIIIWGLGALEFHLNIVSRTCTMQHLWTLHFITTEYVIKQLNS